MPITKDYVKEELTSFFDKVTLQAKKNLIKKNKTASKKLYNSIGYDLKVFKQSYSASLLMEDYADFVDKGVKGVGGTKKNGEKWNVKTVTNSTYKYKNKKPPARAFDKWIVRRGLAGRDKKGRFTSRKSTAFAIANSVYHTGLETTNFYTEPFEKEFKKLPKDLLDAFALNLDNLLT